MIPWSHLDTAQMPGGGEIRLFQRGSEFSIRLGTIELMNSRQSGSEEALATMTRERLPGTQNTRILIGGLGMGFTLRAALEAFGDETAFVVAELVPSVVTWAYDQMSEIFGACLQDPRVSICKKDVGLMIRSTEKASYDAILLDIDNGPEGLTRAANDKVYSAKGLSAARMALKPGGILAVWSSAPDAKFMQRLVRAGFRVDEIKVRAKAKRGGARHIIWFAAA